MNEEQKSNGWCFQSVDMSLVRMSAQQIKNPGMLAILSPGIKVAGWCWWYLNI